MMSGKKVGRGVLRAQARNLKRAWRRVQVNSSFLLEQLLQHLSLGGSSMNVVYERLQEPPAAELVALSGACNKDDDGNQDCHEIGAVQILPVNGYCGDADDGDDDLGQACCINMSTHAFIRCFPYQPLVAAARSHPITRLKRAKSPGSSNYTPKSPSNNSCPSSQIGQPNSPNALGCSSSVSAYDPWSAAVLLKISIIGDAETGKTSFMAKYVWPESTRPEINVETVGVATQEKVVHVKSRSTHIAFSIWDLGGHWQCGSMLPIVCRDAAAILIMFDLTRRSTLSSVMNWFVQARECNKAAIMVMVGTKYDHFVELPLDIQRAVIQQARVYARAMGAPLFFSSATHNINVHKVFKVIVAKLFDLPCPIPINLNFGEPLVDY